jgi:hypothetical protein
MKPCALHAVLGGFAWSCEGCNPPRPPGPRFVHFSDPGWPGALPADVIEAPVAGFDPVVFDELAPFDWSRFKSEKR